MAKWHLAVLPGEGIGPEVTAEACRVLDWLNEARQLDCAVREYPYGVTAYRELGHTLPAATLEAVLAADATLFGATGTLDDRHVPRKIRRQGGLLRLRKELDAFANLRPIVAYESLADASPIRSSVRRGVDLLIVRELTGGVYFGEPRGIETLEDGSRRGIDTQVYTSAEIRRVAKVAFELARERRGLVCSVDKSNVMESGALWRREVTALHEERYRDVELGHLLADNCALQLVRDPRRFDILLADNLFGDLLSDVAAAISGSLGMLPSASLAAVESGGRRRALYEPVHGSAPDIAGLGVANPVGSILSVALALRYSFARPAEADLLERAVRQALEGGARTPDITAPGSPPVSTRQLGDAVLAQLSALV